MTTFDLETALGGLRSTAPASVGTAALVKLGLRDEYAPIDTPLGQVFVAWNGRGVSWVAAGENGATFERTFREKVGRQIDRAPALPPRLRDSIRRRLGGDRRVRIALDLRGHSPFEVAVWTKALESVRASLNVAV